MLNKPQGTYRVRNWREYNKFLVQRGSITLWVSEEVLEKWDVSVKTGRRGRPKEYADELILCALYLKAIYHLPFRAVEGLLGIISRYKINLEDLIIF